MAKQAGAGLFEGECRLCQWVTCLGSLSFSWPRGARARVQPDGGLWEVARVGWWEELLWLHLARGYHPLEWQRQAGGAKPHQGKRWARTFLPPFPLFIPDTHPFHTIHSLESLLLAWSLGPWACMLGDRGTATLQALHLLHHWYYLRCLHEMGVIILTWEMETLRLRVKSPGSESQ